MSSRAVQRNAAARSTRAFQWSRRGRSTTRGRTVIAIDRQWGRAKRCCAPGLELTNDRFSGSALGIMMRSLRMESSLHDEPASAHMASRVRGRRTAPFVHPGGGRAAPHAVGGVAARSQSRIRAWPDAVRAKDPCASVDRRRFELPPRRSGGVRDPRRRNPRNRRPSGTAVEGEGQPRLLDVLARPAARHTAASPSLAVTQSDDPDLGPAECGRRHRKWKSVSGVRP